MYARQRGVHPVVAVVVSAGVSAVGEELFWRGLVQPRLSVAAGSAVAGAILGWVVYVVANLPSANLEIVAGAVVGGAAWTALAWWTAGDAASIACHAAWTTLMVGFPVVQREGGDG
jgi:membrane protease YdiL (CAAX protease family)